MCVRWSRYGLQPIPTASLLELRVPVALQECDAAAIAKTRPEASFWGASVYLTRQWHACLVRQVALLEFGGGV
jgi:hypothetical protein